MPKQAYFTPAAFTFWRQLARNNNREWFNAHKDDYERLVREPYQAFITDMQAPLAKISPHFHADPRKAGGSLYRYFRDTATRATRCRTRPGRARASSMSAGTRSPRPASS